MPRDELMTSSRRQKLFRFLQPLRSPIMIGSMRERYISNPSLFWILVPRQHLGESLIVP